MRRNRVLSIAAIALLTASVSAVSAETRGTLRFGMLALDLEASGDTAVFGDQVDRAVEGYNAAAAAHDRKSGEMTPRIDATDLSVAERLFTISPGLEVGASHYLFRIEAPIGLSADLKSIGLGIYPLGVQAQLKRGLVAYASLGGIASWLDRPGDGDVGGLVMVRAVLGARFGSRIVAEVGYGAYALGGSVNTVRLDDMMTTPGGELPPPDSMISAGEARGLIDMSIGVTF